MMWPYDAGMGWWMLLGGAWILIFWGGLIALVVWLVTRASRHNGPSRRHNPLDIAKERYARGEISREEFEQLKKDLT